LRSPLSLQQLKAIFITHVHGDHCYGLPGLLASAGMSGRTGALTIVGPAPLEKMLRSTIDSTELLLPYELRFVPTEEFASFAQGVTRVQAHKLSHRVPSHAFSFTASAAKTRLRKDRLLGAGLAPGPLWGRFQQGEDVTLPDGRRLRAEDFIERELSRQKVVIAGDNDQPALLAEAVKAADVLVHESTYTEALRLKGLERQHSSAEQVARFAQAQALPNLILTHFSARFHNIPGKAHGIDEIADEAKRFYSGRLFLANDHDEFSLSSEGALIKNSSPGSAAR
jgi:ribonuclease Z